MRILTFIATLALSYAFMRGWVVSLGDWQCAALAAMTLFAGFIFSYHSKSNDAPRFTSSRAANWIDFLSIASALLFFTSLFTLFFTLGPVAGEKLTLKIEDFIESPSSEKVPDEETPEEHSAKPTVRGHGNWLWDSRFTRELPKRTDYRPKARPEVYLQATSSEQAQQLKSNNLYIRAFTLSKFDGERWAMHQPAKRILLPTEQSITLPPDAPWVTDLPVYQHKITHSYYHHGQNVFCGLQGAGMASLPQLTRIADSIFLLPPQEESSWLYEYDVTSQPRLFETITQLPRPITAGTLSDGLDPVYFETLPDHPMRLRLQNWLTQIEDLPDLKRQLTALRDLIRKQCSYSMQVTNPNDLPPLENFLFDEKRGSCEYFATATAMFCRELGIPSRIAFGWSGGKFFESSNLFVFHAADAHAWAEIYIQGYGWTILDSTAANENQTQLAQSTEAAPKPNEDLKQSEPAPTTPADPPADPTLSWQPLTWALAATLILVAAALWLRRRLTLSKRAQQRAWNQAEPDYLTAFRKACSQRSLPMRGSRTLRQQIHFLEKNHCKPDFAEQILNYHYGCLYRGEPRRAGQEKLLIQLAQRWGAQRNHSS